MDWFPLCNYTHYSLQKGFSKPKQLAKKCSENYYTACGIADYKSISGAVSFYQACIANNIKPIIGCSFDGFSLFAKNKDGWFDHFDYDKSSSRSQVHTHTHIKKYEIVSRKFYRDAEFVLKYISYLGYKFFYFLPLRLYRDLLLNALLPCFPPFRKRICFFSFHSILEVENDFSQWKRLKRIFLRVLQQISCSTSAF